MKDGRFGDFRVVELVMIEEKNQTKIFTYHVLTLVFQLPMT
jgi:hypothetical protein